MKLVTFAVAQAPHGVGDKRLVPDEVADRLLAEGVAASVEAWPGPVPAHPVRKPAREVVKPHRPSGAADQRIAR